MSLSEVTVAAVGDAQVSTFENGLVAIVREDRSAPVTSAQVWCRAGSVDEGRWLGAGLSHVLEHMLFKGTTTRGTGRIDQEVHDAGGYMNAYTSFDRTVYWINVPNTGSAVAIDILADIVQHATLPEEELTKELDVIRREMDMGHDDPARRSSRRLFETAYTRSPYRYPIIGLPDIFNTLTREDVVSYYREKYAPNNLFLVVVGDVETAAVIQQVGKAFAGARARPVPGIPLADEPRQTAPRERIESAAIELGHVHYSWHIPELRHPDIPALDILSVVLGGGRSSRLHREVRERLGVVHSADAWTYNPGSPGLFGVSAVVDADKHASAHEAMLREVDKVRAGSVSPAELGKALKQITASTLAIRKTMHGQAQDLGSSWLVVGDLGYSERYLNAAQRVTCEDLQRVALSYLTEENRTHYALLPGGTEAPVPTVKAAEAAEPVTRWVLANGLRVLVKEDRRLPFVDFRAVLQGGVLAETKSTNGITGLMTKLLLKGTETRDAEQIASQIESVGGSLDVYGGNNSFGVVAEVMDSDFPLGLELVTDVLRRPAFPAHELEREREYQLAGIRAQKDQLLQLAGRAMRRALFGDEGYGLDALGTDEAVSGLTLDTVRAMHRRLAVPNNCVLAIFGRVNKAAVRDAVERALGDWVAADSGLQPLREPGPAVASRRTEEARGKKQAVVVLGFRGVALSNPDRYALDLLQEACSDLGSRLFMRIRDDLGLAYYVGAQNFVGLVPGYFSFYAGTEPAKSSRVIDEFLQEIATLRATGLSAEELRRAQAKVVGHRKISRQDLGSNAMTMALDELYGLGYDHGDGEDARYEAVTQEDIVRVARRYLDPAVASQVVVQSAGANGEPATDSAA